MENQDKKPVELTIGELYEPRTLIYLEDIHSKTFRQIAFTEAQFNELMQLLSVFFRKEMNGVPFLNVHLRDKALSAKVLGEAQNWYDFKKK